jgi:ectoine hydroxylase
MGTDLDHHLTPAEQAVVERDGFLVRHDVFTPTEVATMLDESEALLDRLVRDRQSRRVQASGYVFDTDRTSRVIIKWEGDTDIVHGIEPFAHLSQPLADWGRDRRLIEPMTHFVGDDQPELYTEKLNLKRPRHGGANPLHQDYPYWVDSSEGAAQIATTIIFLDDSTVENGCLWVVPGSHRQGMWSTRTDGDDFAHNEVDVTAYPDAEVVAVEVGAGSTVSFGAFLAHKSAPNTSDKERRALLYSYQPPGRRRLVDYFDGWFRHTDR